MLDKKFMELFKYFVDKSDGPITVLNIMSWMKRRYKPSEVFKKYNELIDNGYLTKVKIGKHSFYTINKDKWKS